MSKEKELKQSSDYGWNHPIDPAWEYEPYDGIKGFPPEWVPEPRMREFCVDRGCLFFEVEQGKATYLEIKSRFDWMKDDKDTSVRMLLFPGERKDYDECLSFLVWLFKAVSLDEEKGLALLAGDVAVSGLHSRQGYKKRDDYQDKRECQDIAKRLWQSKPESTIAALMRSTELAAYARKYNGRHTLRDWLKEIDHRTPEMKRSRLKKK